MNSLDAEKGKQNAPLIKRNPVKAGIGMILTGIGCFIFSTLIYTSAKGGIEIGFFSGVLNGMFLSSFILFPMGLILLVYGLATKKRRQDQ